MKRTILYILFLCAMCCATAINAVAQINTERVMNIGRNALQFEDYVLSIQYFNQVIKLKPYWADPYYYRAVAKLSLDDLEGAEEDATACIERNPFFNNIFFLRGVVRQNMQDYEGAIADYKQGLELQPEHRDLLNNMAIAYVQLNDYDAADSVYIEMFRRHPSYAPAYIARGQFNMMRGDTLTALTDLNRAIELDHNRSDAYAMRSLLQMKYDGNLTAALDDMNHAIKLEPRRTDYYINRALIKFYNDDLRGAMADYDYVLLLDPYNMMTYYNRGLLRAQVGDRNRAIDDFCKVLEHDPHNYQAIFNRAILYDLVGMYEAAIADYNAVLDVYPEYAEALFSRSEAKRKIGNTVGGEKDFKEAMRLQEAQKYNPQMVQEASDKAVANIASRKASDRSINKYDRLMVADEDLAQVFEAKYESKVRGRVQDRNVMVSLQPLYVLTYYERPNELRMSSEFSDDLDRFNEQKVLKYPLVITNQEIVLQSSQITEHFASATEYGRAIESAQGNMLLNYMGRSLDLMLLQDYAEALNDINEVIEMSPNFMLPYFQRAVLRYKNMEFNRNTSAMNNVPSQQLGVAPMSAKGLDLQNIEYELIIADLNKAIELSPRFGYAYYNRANIQFALDNVNAAIDDYTEAIKLQPDMADAYFNRGLAYIKAGNEKAGRDDLSKAGEMGVMAAYNILKRIEE